jgi:hypothetical protein
VSRLKCSVSYYDTEKMLYPKKVVFSVEKTVERVVPGELYRL